MSLPCDLTAELRSLSRRARSIARKEARALLDLGSISALAKDIVSEHGSPRDFTVWIQDSHLSRSAVYKAIAAHRVFGSVANADKQPRTVLELLAGCPEAAEEAIPLIEKGNRLTIKAAKKLRSRYSPTASVNPSPAGTLKTFKTSFGKLAIRLDTPDASNETVRQALAAALRSMTDSLALPPEKRPTPETARSLNPFKRAG